MGVEHIWDLSQYRPI